LVEWGIMMCTVWPLGTEFLPYYSKCSQVLEKWMQLHAASGLRGREREGGREKMRWIEERKRMR
jgi:hypothetical protein